VLQPNSAGQLAAREARRGGEICNPRYKEGKKNLVSFRLEVLRAAPDIDLKVHLALPPNSEAISRPPETSFRR
jgi:hypothetical protein